MVWASTNYTRPRKKPRSRRAMIDYLRDHPRYHTLSSHNLATSYARNIKVTHVVPDDLQVRAYEMLDQEDAFWGGQLELDEFAVRHGHAWQIGGNGRSGGYLVLYRGGRKASGHRSVCGHCGQRNFCRVMPELPDNAEGRLRAYVYTHAGRTWPTYRGQSEAAADAAAFDDAALEALVKSVKDDIEKNGRVTADNVCGKCRRPTRRNFATPQYDVFVQPGRGTDEEDTFDDRDEWSTDRIRDRVDLVWDFDLTVDAYIEAFVHFVRTHVVEEETVLVEKTIKVARPISGGDDEEETQVE